MISLDDLFLARFAIAKVRLLPARLTAPPTLILLLPVGRFSVLDKLIAATVIALDDFAYHPLAYQSLLSHYPEMKNVISEVEQWVDGSFTTHKENPGDIDLLNVFDKDVLDRLSISEQVVIQNLVAAKNTQVSHSCDSYAIIRVPETHPDFDTFRRARKYWMGEFGFDRDDNPKGIVRMQLGNGLSSESSSTS